MKRSTLIHQNPIIFTPDLARIIGLNCAIVLQKLEFLLDIPKSGKVVDGEKWIYNSYEEWQSDHFPFWSVDTIMRSFQALEKAAFVRSKQPEGRGNRMKYYRITDAAIAMLHTENIPEKYPDTDKLRLTKHTDKMSVTETDKMSVSYNSTENPENHIGDSRCSSPSFFRRKAFKKVIPSKPNTITPQANPDPQPAATAANPPKEKSSAQKEKVSASEVFESWNQLQGIATARVLNDARQRTILRRLKDPFFCEHWREAMRVVEKTPFFTGENDRGWRADLDFFLRMEKFTKIVEGGYSGTPKNGNGHAPSKSPTDRMYF